MEEHGRTCIVMVMSATHITDPTVAVDPASKHLGAQANQPPMYFVRDARQRAGTASPDRQVGPTGQLTGTGP